jgi:N6-L-threonylcarbamoyladenine synthase
MKNPIVVGIDTSNYTSSVAVCSLDGKVLYSAKSPLPVKEGECGLRQSDAVFAHVKNLPELMRSLKGAVGTCNIVGVGVSQTPRRAKGSYMPCFLAGVASAESLSVSSGCEVYGFSHQEGHVAAALYSASKLDLIGSTFAAFHVSGGTTDILLVQPCDNEVGFSLERIGGTLDINCGQAIDRAGVMLGMGFPCGAELERLAIDYFANRGGKTGATVCVRGLDCNLSGLQNKAQKLWSDSSDKEAVAAYVFDFVSKTLEKLTASLREKYPDIPIVFAGGVMSSSIISKRLKNRFGGIYFAEPAFSSDNACGIAVLTCRRVNQKSNF